jgi:TPR repeat protein
MSRPFTESVVENWRMVVVLTALALGTGCHRHAVSPPVDVTVNSFAAPTTNIFETYVIVPQGAPSSALEFDELARHLRKALESHNLLPARSAERADLQIVFGFEVGPPRTHYYTVSRPIWGQTGVSSSRTTTQATIHGNQATMESSTTYQPRYGITGFAQERRSRTLYSRYAFIRAFDAERDRNGEPELLVWETRIVSEGTTDDLSRVFPAMLAAASEFLGGSTGGAVSRTVTLHSHEVARVTEMSSDGRVAVDWVPRERPEHYRERCDRDDFEACDDLGLLLFKGRTKRQGKGAVAPDVDGAAKVYRDACERGHSSACWRHGLLHSTGALGDHDYRQQVWSWRAACSLGNPDGCWLHGVYHEKGRGVAADRDEAQRLYAKACVGGHQTACLASSERRPGPAAAVPTASTRRREAQAPVRGPLWFRDRPPSPPIRRTRSRRLDATKVYEQASKSVYHVGVLDERGELAATGSAVAVTERHLLTNWHVVEGSHRLFLKRGDVVMEATIFAGDPSSDLCWLRIDGTEGKLEPVRGIRALDSIQVGEPAYSIGNPKSLESTIGEGIVSQLRTSHFIQTSAPISSGSSGGGLFDAEGNLMGITTKSRPDGQQLNFAIAAQRFWDDEPVSAR